MKQFLNKLCFITLFIVGIFNVNNLYSADTVTIGTAYTSSYGIYLPYYYYGHDVARVIYTKQELGNIGAMNFKEMAFQVCNAYNTSYPGHDTLSIYMRHIANSSYSTYLNTTIVYNNSYWSNDYQLVYRVYNRSMNKSSNQWDNFVFDEEFEYNGEDNLEVLLVGKNTGNYASSTHAYFYYWMFSATGQMDFASSYRTSSSGTYWGGTMSYKPHTRFVYEQGPELKEIFAFEEGHLFATSSTGGDIYAPYVKFTRKPTEPTVQIQYKILDPNGEIAFEGLDPNTGSTWINMPTNLVTRIVNDVEIPATYYFKKAHGALADTSNPDTSKINFRQAGVIEGEYTVIASIRFMKDGEQMLKTKTTSFEVSYDYDIAMTDVSEPLSFENTSYKYPFGNTPLRMSFVAMNRGVNPISNFVVICNVENKDKSNGKVGVIWTKVDTMRLQTPMERGESVAIDIDEFIISQLSGYVAGTYYVSMELILLDGNEENLANNNYKNIDVRLEYPYDGVVDGIVYPTSNDNVYKNQICMPVIKVRNAGAFSASEIPLRVEIEYKGNVVYDNTENISFLAERGDNLGRDSLEYTFSTAFKPTSEGQYTIRATISTEDDSNPGDNVYNSSFTVIGSLKGDLTVGKSSRFHTLKEAVNAIYERGVEGTVNIVLSDPIIEVGSIDDEYSLDFSSSISGFDASVDKIRIVPSKSLSRMQGGVTLKLNSKSGLGMRFASSINPDLPSAPVNKVSFKAKKEYYPFNAVVEIDGGVNKAIRIVSGDIPVGQKNNVLLYFAEGASNVTVKNCLLEGETNDHTDIPLVLWNRERNEFSYDALTNLSSCILLRNLPPMDEFGLNRTYALDTITIHNIDINNNIIENGGYGLVSIGIGALYNSGAGQFERYYNNNNNISDNMIVGQSRSGIYLGYESDTKVSNNRIYKIGYVEPVSGGSGIILGGEGKVNAPTLRGIMSDNVYETFGYNNINIVLDGNEISHVKSTDAVHGIKIEQERNNFYDMHIVSGKHPYIPDTMDNIKIYNNLVWQISTTDEASGRYGIRLYTTRDKETTSNSLEEFAIQKELSYNILGSSIINNAVLIDEDGISNPEGGYIGGIVVQNVDEFTMYNNAVNILDSTNTSDIVSAFVLESVRPDYVDIDIDNNIYNTIGEESSIVRFMELSQRDNSLYSIGYKNEFYSLDQWQYWTGKEGATTTYDFTGNLYEQLNSKKIPLKRIKSPVPIGSYLNNRGKVCSEVVYDIDKKLRGSADQGYDIGAWEFDGQLYDNDLGILTFVSPVSYKDNREESVFSDAEYLMTTNPISVQVNIRNNGSVKAENKPVTLTIYNYETGEEVLRVVEEFTIGAFELKTLDFKTDNKKLADRLFNAVPYGIGNAPERFATMANNVTPIYRFVVELPVDEDMSNNVNSVEKLVRFYIKKSNLHLLISGEHTTLVPLDVQDYTKYILEEVPATELSSIVGYSNYKSLRTAFEKLGFELQENRFENGSDTVITAGFDIFDRTNWESHSVNYSVYNSIFWADGLESVFDETTEDNINKFLALSTESHKRNLVISSEELARNSYARYTAMEQPDYFQGLFNTKPLKNGIHESHFDANGYDYITGALLATGLETSFRNTTLLPEGKDVELAAAIFDKVGSSDRVLGQAYYYSYPEYENRSLKTMGTVSYSLRDFLIYLGIDWRHYTKPEFVLGSIIDFINNNSGSIVPVTLLSFEANPIGNSVELHWSTASEVNSSDFVIERKGIDETSYTDVYRVKSTGNTMTGSDYSYIDRSLQGGSYLYRLRLEDLDGSYSYSEERMVSLGSSELQLSVITNPVVSHIQLGVTIPSMSSVRISLVDMSGLEAAVILDKELSSGTYNLDYSVTDIASGTYNVLMNVNGSIISKKVTIVK